MASHYDAVIIESFGVGGLPSCENWDFCSAIEKWVVLGKTVVMTTQVTNEGSNMSVYEVGHTIKQEFGLLEAYDMTLEATVTKLMWMPGADQRPESNPRFVLSDHQPGYSVEGVADGIFLQKKTASYCRFFLQTF